VYSGGAGAASTGDLKMTRVWARNCIIAFSYIGTAS
jgi:hypothetical protein